MVCHGNFAVGGCSLWRGGCCAIGVGFCVIGLIPFAGIAIGLIPMAALRSGLVFWRAGHRLAINGLLAIAWNVAAGNIAIAHDFAMGHQAVAAHVNTAAAELMFPPGFSKGANCSNAIRVDEFSLDHTAVHPVAAHRQTEISKCQAGNSN